MNWDDIKVCTVPISDLRGDIHGAGFFISPEGHLLTCARVVRSAGGWEQVRVRGQSLNAVYLGDRSPDDFAVLRVSNYTGEAVPLSLPSASLDRFLTLAYSSPDSSGESFDGTRREVGPESNLEKLSVLSLRIRAGSQNLGPGFRGSPVFDVESQRVVGIVSEYDSSYGVEALSLSELSERWPEAQRLLKEEPTRVPIESAPEKKRIFISYSSQDPDLSLAQQFYEALRSAGNEVFMAAESLRLGDEWPQYIDSALEQCDYFLLLLSPQSAVSDMVTEEVKHAKHLRDTRPERKPRILPIRVRFPFEESLNYELRGYLNRLQQRLWQSPSDTRPILDEVLSLVSAGVSPRLTVTQGFRAASAARFDGPPLPSAEPEWPGGQVPTDSNFYVKRLLIDEKCFKEVDKSRVLIRIKAPRQMGKTSLLARILHHARVKSTSAYASFQLVHEARFSDLNKLLRWFCISTGKRLSLPNRVSQMWDDDEYDVMENCTNYFAEYLLPESGKPIVLGLDEVDRLFEYPAVARDFFGLLRGWHDLSKSDDVWSNLKLILVHSTECYVEMDVYQSPFSNVGLPINLTDFEADQVSELAERHGLRWDEEQVDDLMQLVSGHPYLVRVAMYFISLNEMSFDVFMETAPTEAGKYSDHLRRHLYNLERHPELAEAMKKALRTNDPVTLKSELAFKLEGMGLATREGDRVKVSRKLYKKYFRKRFGIPDGKDDE